MCDRDACCCPIPPMPGCCPPMGFANVGCCPVDNRTCLKGRKIVREKRWPACNFLKPCIDTRIYRNGEHLSISYAGHIPGEMYVYGRNLPTASTFCKRRLCTFTPYEFVDHDGCCTFP